MQSATPFKDAASFWDKIAPKYAKKPIADLAAYEAKLTRIRAFLKPTDHILEIGCGTGGTALRLAPSVSKVTATDISRAMIAIAQDKQNDAGTGNVTFQVATAQHALADAPFDVITAFSLLHLVDDLPTVLAAVYGQTKPGGLFLSKTVCLGEGHFALRLLVRALRVIGFAPKILMLTTEQLRDALSDAGFDLQDTEYFGKSRMNPFIVAKRPA